MITDATAGDFLSHRHPDFTPIYTELVKRWDTEIPIRYLLFRCFAEEIMVPQLRTGSTEERAAVFDTVEKLIADGDILINDAVDHQVIDELVHVGYTYTAPPKKVLP